MARQNCRFQLLGVDEPVLMLRKQELSNLLTSLHILEKLKDLKTTHEISKKLRVQDLDE